jgi:hypothetical protein
MKKETLETVLSELGCHFMRFKEMNNSHGRFWRVHGRADCKSTDWGYSISGKTKLEAVVNLRDTLLRQGVLTTSKNAIIS